MSDFTLSLVLSGISLGASLAHLVILLAKHFSTHKIEYVSNAKLEEIKQSYSAPTDVPPEELQKLSEQLEREVRGFMNFQNGSTGLND